MQEELKHWQLDALFAAQERYETPDISQFDDCDAELPVVHGEGGFPVLLTEGPDAPRCNTLIGRGALAGRRCPKVAGQGTVHLGAGTCVAHGGAKRYGRSYGAWIVAHAFAEEMNITPWEALLKAVRIAAGKSAYCEWVLSQAKDDLELEGRFGRSEDGILLHPDTGEVLGGGQLRDLSFWIQKSELWHDRLAKTAKMAVDAGVATWLVEQQTVQAQAIGEVLNAVLEALEGDVSESTLLKMRAVMRSKLLELDARDTGQNAIAGTHDARVVDGVVE